MVQSKVTQVLSNAKLPKPNLTKKKRLNLWKLQGYDDIIVMSADKGNRSVVMDKNNYYSKFVVLLNNTATYKILTKHPNLAIEKRLNGYIWKFYEGKKIRFDLYTGKSFT